jgi:hypothetical protein
VKGFFIDASRRIIEPFDYEYRDLGRKIGGSITLGHVFPNKDVLYVEDEALLRPAEKAFRIYARPDGQPMMSDGIVTGADSIDPDAKVGTLPPTFTLAELQNQIGWLTVEQALLWFRACADQPAVTHRTDGQSTVVAHWRDLLTNLEGGEGYHPDQVPL